jgi:putative CocE/NonD family hydrolase
MRRSLIIRFLFLCLLVWVAANTSERRVAAQVDASSKPAPAPPRWRPLIGEYELGDQTLIVLERDGTLNALFNRKELAPLQEVSKNSFKFASPSARKEAVVFSQDAGGRVTQVEIGKSVYKRRPLGPEEGSNQLRVEPLRPVPELIKEARTAQPPNESGDFLPTDLVELQKLDPTIKLEVRYATTNNLFGTVFYSEPRAFMQRPAAEALVRVNAKLKALGYGLLVHDAYRPWYVTKVFWDATPDDKKKFVADPSKGSRHNRGCAVDLTLYDLKSGKPIEMVSTYDETTDRAYPDYPGGTSLQRWHRDLLRREMESEGFTVYEAEWWHFDYKDWQKYHIGNVAFDQIGLVVAPAQQPEKGYEVKIEFNHRVPMRDRTELSADVYRPQADGRFPVILSRTPYTKTSGSTLKIAQYFVFHGYVFVAMDVRGRGDSDGTFEPYRNEGRDGYDAVEWCAAQPWSTGKVGTIGGSYNGAIQWLAAVQQPPHLAAMIALASPSDPFVEWPTGQPLPMDISWYHFTAGHVLQNMEAVDWKKIYEHLPLITMDEAIGRPNRFWKEEVEHARLDSWWDDRRYQNKYERVRVPVLNISGWYDDEQVGTPLNFIGVTTKAASAEIRRSQRLLIGPWPHAINSSPKLGQLEFGPTAVIDMNAYWLRWFDHWLKGVDNNLLQDAPVRIFVMGENAWHDEKEWPIAGTEWTKYYLHSNGRANTLSGDGTLSTTVPAQEPTDTYSYDPAKPVPFITDPSFAQIGGPDDYREVEQRSDVLVYTSEPLTADIEVCGPLRVRLAASSSARDTDFMAKLIDVWPNGFAQRLNDGMVRARFREGMDKPSLIEAGRVYNYDLDLWNTCQVYRAGHRIRVEISSSAFPKYDRNLNTGDTLGQSTRMQVAQQTIFHDAQRVSYIVLPIIPRRR